MIVTVAVPLSTLQKQPLKRLDVVSAEGGAVPVWGRAENGRLKALPEKPKLAPGGMD